MDDGAYSSIAFSIQATSARANDTGPLNQSEDVLAAIRADIRSFLDRYSNQPKPGESSAFPIAVLTLKLGRIAILSFSRHYAGSVDWQAPFPADEPSLLSWLLRATMAPPLGNSNPLRVRIPLGLYANKSPHDRRL